MRDNNRYEHDPSLKRQAEERLKEITAAYRKLESELRTRPRDYPPVHTPVKTGVSPYRSSYTSGTGNPEKQQPTANGSSTGDTGESHETLNLSPRTIVFLGAGVCVLYALYLAYLIAYRPAAFAAIVAERFRPKEEVSRTVAPTPGFATQRPAVDELSIALAMADALLLENGPQGTWSAAETAVLQGVASSDLFAFYHSDKWNEKYNGQRMLVNAAVTDIAKEPIGAASITLDTESENGLKCILSDATGLEKIRKGDRVHVTGNVVANGTVKKFMILHDATILQLE